MNTCVTLLMGLAALGYQPLADDTLPIPAPPAEEIAPLPLPVEKPPVIQPPVDTFAPEPVPPAPVHPSPTGSAAPLSIGGPEAYDEPVPVHSAPFVPLAAPFHTEPLLMPVPMTHGHPSASCQCDGRCAEAAPAERSCRDRGCLGKCCENSTCDMPPHIAYFPALHGYYDFQPYNYTHIAKHQALIMSLGGDPRAPYSTADFARFYEAVPTTAGEALPFEPTLRPLPHLSRRLPNLEALLHGPAGP